MRPTSALLALAIAASFGFEGFADDAPRPAPAPSQPSKGWFSRFRRPTTPEVPPNPPRQLPPRTTPATRDEAPAPGWLGGKDVDAPVRRTQATVADLGPGPLAAEPPRPAPAPKPTPASAQPRSEPAPAPSKPSKGLLDRFRKPTMPEVPPNPPRQLPPKTTLSVPPEAGRLPLTPRPSTIDPTPPPVASRGPLQSIPTGPRPSPATGKETDAPVRRTQATAADLGMPIGPGSDSTSTSAVPGGSSLSLEQALTGALTSNPDLIALRQGNPALASAEAVEVARHFPVALNPTLFIDYRPITLIPNGTFGTTGPGAGGTGSAATKTGGFYHYGQNYVLIALRQPVEFGHQTTHRYSIAKAAYKQVQWQIVQAELTALVQTYRFFQTAAYRRERLRVAEQLADFNENLLKTLQRRLEAGQAPPADVALAKVESRATRQLARAARQDYITALTDLRNQIGIPETAAETEPLGEFTLPSNIPPVDEQALIQAALSCRPDLHASQAAIEGAGAAVRLARGDMTPTTIIGPQYVQDEAGIQYVGLNLVPTLPILNSGKPLLRQRQAEERRAVVSFQQAQQRAVAQVRSAVAKWNGATALVNDSSGLTQELSGDVASLERLFEQNQTGLAQVQQARQRLIQLETAQLDALWNATQAQADLMLAVGVPSMIQNLLQTAEAGAGMAGAPLPNQPGAPPAFAPTPPTPTVNPAPFAPPAGR
jgi:cobalt-zinc-cadmium efflux system outer membrane protein